MTRTNYLTRPFASLLALGMLGTSGCYDGRLVDLAVDPGLGRPPAEESPIQVDRIVQIEQPLVDVLFIVDNSCSMSEEQRLLADNFPDFMDYFTDSGLDFHIGVISTDMEDTANHAGKLRRVNGLSYIDQDTTNPAGAFSLMANMGTGGAIQEQGRAAAYTMVELKPDIPRNEGFYREDAALHLIFISDEEDQSGNVPVSLAEFRTWMRNKKTSPDMVTAHSIVGIPGQSCAAIDTAGSQYIAYADATGGVLFNLCEPDWSPLLEELGLQTSGLKREYFLSRIPRTSPLTLEVEVITKDLDGNPVTLRFPTCVAGEETDECRVAYNPGRNSIVFLDYTPDALAEILVQYNPRDGYTDP